MDLETVLGPNGEQIVICVTVKLNTLNNGVITKLFMNDLIDPVNGGNNMWKSVIDFINNLIKPNDDVKSKKPFKYYIYTHNLGSFDGYFIYKGLAKLYSDNPYSIGCIIDNHNKFININILFKKHVLIFLDSLRLFPVKLNDLAEQFNTPGKLSEYNQDFNNLELLRSNSKLLEQFSDYALQDVISLFDIMTKAQTIYIELYNIDITTVVSLPSLSLKIFRLNFKTIPIPILKGIEDEFIRNAYFGGHTDISEAYSEDLHYYDIISLYPNAMLNDLPGKFIKDHKNMKAIKLENFFGFVKVIVETLPNLKVPLLPYRDYETGRVSYPIGKWTGTYFSQELLAVLPHGYKITLIEGREYERVNGIFTDYVNNFFSKKANSTGSERFIAKLHLNTLYGVFGRRQDNIETLNINNGDLPKYISTRLIKGFIEINENTTTLLMYTHIHSEILSKLKNLLSTKSLSYESTVKSNVAIAAAITSYARIHMIPYLLLGVLYTDTYSIFTKYPLPDHLLGKELGMMKDELNGLTIKQACFIDIKKYGYWFIDKDGNRIEKSVIAGVKRDSISFDEITRIFNGEVITKDIPNRFNKSVKDLNIIIKDTTVSIDNNSYKTRKDNIYLPLYVNTIDNKMIVFINRFINKIINKIKKIKEYFNIS